MTLGEKIRACRRKAGLTQEQLAEAVGVSRQAVTKWEQDQSAPGTAHLMALAQALSLPAGELLEPDAPAGDAPLKEALAILRAEEKRRADRRLRCARRALRRRGYARLRRRARRGNPRTQAPAPQRDPRRAQPPRRCAPTAT